MDSIPKPRILIISLAYLPFIGGAEIAVSEITKRLGSPAGEFEFDLITCNLDSQQKDEEQIGNVKVYRVGKGKIGKYLFPFLAYKKVFSLCHPRGSEDLAEEERYKIIWSIMANQAGLAGLFFKKKFPQSKFLLTLQEGDSVFSIWKKTWYIRPLYKAIYRSADYIQAISTFLANRAVKYGYKGRIDIIPNGVIIPEKNQPTDYRKKGGKNILTVSRLVEKNGIEDLIKAFKIFITNYQLPITSYQLQIIGTGTLEKSLKSLVQKLNLNDKIEFLGKLSYDETQKYYTKANVFIRPSLSEGLGNVFLEAMATEVPVIATPVGGIPDFLIDSGENQTGWFCQPKNPKSIAEKINYVLDEKNQEDVARVVKNARKMVIEKYTWEIIAEKMKKIFDSMLS